MKMGYVLLYVDDVDRAMNFYEKAFGLSKAFSLEGQYGEMVTGSTKLGFVQHTTALTHQFKYRPLDRSDIPPGIEIGFVAADVQAAYSHALAAGATSASEPTVKPWGQTVCYVRDLNGFLVEICSDMG
jgi:lactoylglutathione lyase